MKNSPVIGLVGSSEIVPIDLIAVGTADFEDWLESRKTDQAWIQAHDLSGKTGDICRLPDPDGGIMSVVVGVGAGEPTDWGALPKALGPGVYQIARLPDGTAWDHAALGWSLGSYRFDRFRRSDEKPFGRLLWPEQADRTLVGGHARATALVRDLINLPTSHMGPADLQKSAEDLAGAYGADIATILGDDLLAENYPAVHAVGRAAARDRAPRLIEMTWGDSGNPKVALVGKGVCFDTGGLDIKPAAAMRLMKKDMGGAAHVLGLGLMIMDMGLPIRLTVLIPAVENSIAGNAMRPGDVVNTRNGKTVEIGNTDAEGRVILADALARASELDPALIIDFATLTGAARVALGTDLPALFTRGKALREALTRAGEDVSDPLWPLPLHEPYRHKIKGKVADLNNAPEGPHGGAITAALFLDEFVAKGLDYAHIDLMAWNTVSRPGRPEGGEAMGMRAVFETIRKQYGNWQKGT